MQLPVKVEGAGAEVGETAVFKLTGPCPTSVGEEMKAKVPSHVSAIVRIREKIFKAE